MYNLRVVGVKPLKWYTMNEIPDLEKLATEQTKCAYILQINIMCLYLESVEMIFICKSTLLPHY